MVPNVGRCHVYYYTAVLALISDHSIYGSRVV